MRLYQTERIRRVLRRLPRGGPLAWLEIVLIVGLGIQLARLFWTIATPLGPYGDWRPREASVMAPAARAALFAHFDPFFRNAPDLSTAQAVTSLNLQLFGVRLNEASGLGSAIIATPDGQQNSYAVGDEVVSGVKLKAVAVDHVVLDKGGREESLFIDQSTPAPIASPGGFASPPTGSPAVASPPAAAPDDLAGTITSKPVPDPEPVIAQPGGPMMSPSDNSSPRP